MEKEMATVVLLGMIFGLLLGSVPSFLAKQTWV